MSERNHDNSRVPDDAIGVVEGGYVTTRGRLVDGAWYSRSSQPAKVFKVELGSNVPDDILVAVPVEPPPMASIEADVLERLVEDARLSASDMRAKANARDRCSADEAIAKAREGRS